MTRPSTSTYYNDYITFRIHIRFSQYISYPDTTIVILHFVYVSYSYYTTFRIGRSHVLRYTSYPHSTIISLYQVPEHYNQYITFRIYILQLQHYTVYQHITRIPYYIPYRYIVRIILPVVPSYSV